MAITLGEAIVWLRGNSEDLDKALTGAEQKTKSFASRLGSAAKEGLTGLIVTGATAIVEALAESPALAAKEQVAIQKLASTVKATGADWGTAEKAINKYLESELKRTALDDGDGREAIDRLTQSTGSYQEALDLMGLTQDFARAKGIDLASAADIVGKVHGGNVGILKRYNMTLDDGTTAQEALKKMQEQSAGQAEEYGKTAEGSQKKLDIAIGNLKETIGGALTGPMANLATWLADMAIKYLPDVERFITGTFVPALETLGKVLTTVWEGFQKVVEWATNAINKLREWTGAGSSGGSSGTVPTNAQGQTPFGFAYGGAHANGGDFVVNRPTSILVGEAYQPERVTVTPLNRAGAGKGWGSFEFHYHDESGSHKAQATNQARAWEHRYVMGLA